MSPSLRTLFVSVGDLLRLFRSRGGDLFTDFDANAGGLPTCATGAAAHRGVLSAAQVLERELRPTLKVLAQADGIGTWPTCF